MQPSSVASTSRPRRHTRSRCQRPLDPGQPRYYPARTQTPAAISTPDGPPPRLRRPPFDDSVRIYVPLLARPWIMHACHADASCHLGGTRTLKMLEGFFWWVGMEACTKWWVRRCLKCQARILLLPCLMMCFFVFAVFLVSLHGD